MAEFDLTAVLKANISDFQSGMQEAKNSLSNLGTTLTNVGKTMTAGLTVPIVAMGTFASKSAMDMETAMIGVAKTTDMSGEALANMRKEIFDMSREVPLAATEIAGIAEAAGQLGVSEDEIVNFTRVMADLGVATNMTAEEAATTLARFANITGMVETEYSNLGSTIVELGNNFATTESEISALGLRLAASGSIAGMSEADILGLSAAMSSLGINAESGGTAMSMSINQIDSAVKAGGEELTAFASVAGVSAEEFAASWEADPAQALNTFIEGLGGVIEEGGDVNAVLESLGITGERQVDVLKRLANGEGILAEALAMANDAWLENSALSKEAQTAYKSTANQIQLMKNAFFEVATVIGDVLLPVIAAVAQKIAEVAQKFADWFSGLDEGQQKMIVLAGAIIAAIGPALLVIGTLMKLAAGLKLAMLAPIIGGLALLAGVLTFAYKNSDKLKGAVDGLMKGFKDGKTLKKAGDHLAKIGKSMKKVFGGIKKFAEPAFEFLGDLVGISLESMGGFVSSVGKLMKGDWKGAWETFKDTSTSAVKGVVDSLKKNGPKMWDNIKGVASGIWQAFRDIDWGLVLSEINSFFGGIAGQITSIDWYAVGVAVSGTVADLGIAISDYINDTFGDGKMGDLIMKAISEMFDPRSDLNVDAGKFTNAVMETLDGIADGISQALGGFNITESAAIWKGKLIQFFSGLKNTWEELANTDWAESIEMGTVIEDIKAAVSKGFEGIEFDPITFEWPEFNWGDWSEQVQKLKDEFNTVIDTIKEAISTGDWSEALGMTGPIEADTSLNVNEPTEVTGYEAVQAFINSKLAELGGEGEQVIATPRLVIDILKGEGVPDNEIQNVIDIMFNGKEYDANTIVVPDLEVKEEKESISQKVSSFFAGLKPVTASAQVEVTPDVSVAGGSGKSGGLTGAVGGGLSGTFSALQAEVTAQMTAISASVSTAMTTVSTDMQTGMTNAQTAVQSAMVSIVSTATAGMLSMVVAGRLGTTMFNIAFRAGLAQAVVTAQSIVSQIISVFSNLSSSMANAGRMAGAGFNSGLASQAGAIIGTANSIANSVASTIQSALRIQSPSKVTTYLGEMVGAGLIAGMDGMFSGVESSANRLSLAALPTTDLGSARYSVSVSGQSTSSKLDEVIDAINRGQVIMMDSGALVGETSRQMDVALGQQGSLGGRHKL